MQSARRRTTGVMTPASGGAVATTVYNRGQVWRGLSGHSGNARTQENPGFFSYILDLLYGAALAAGVPAAARKAAPAIISGSP
jgi:hypothetical protein